MTAAWCSLTEASLASRDPRQGPSARSGRSISRARPAAGSGGRTALRLPRTSRGFKGDPAVAGRRRTAGAGALKPRRSRRAGALAQGLAEAPRDHELLALREAVEGLPESEHRSELLRDIGHRVSVDRSPLQGREGRQVASFAFRRPICQRVRRSSSHMGARGRSRRLGCTGWTAATRRRCAVPTNEDLPERATSSRLSEPRSHPGFSRCRRRPSIAKPSRTSAPTTRLSFRRGRPRSAATSDSCAGTTRASPSMPSRGTSLRPSRREGDVAGRPCSRRSTTRGSAYTRITRRSARSRRTGRFFARGHIPPRGSPTQQAWRGWRTNSESRACRATSFFGPPNISRPSATNRPSSRAAGAIPRRLGRHRGARYRLTRPRAKHLVEQLVELQRRDLRRSGREQP